VSESAVKRITSPTGGSYNGKAGEPSRDTVSGSWPGRDCGRGGDLVAVPLTWFILAASVALLAVAIFLRHRAKALGLARGTGDEILVSHVHGLTGKPDYILKASDELIPVERKSRVVSAAGAYEGEILQLAAYCMLVEEHFGKPVRRGQLAYQNRSMEVAFVEELRGRLLNALAALRLAESNGDIARNHNSPARCRGCGYRRTCRDSLAFE
jgi:CRISPR-associated exonuclease Cas4